MTVVLVQTRAIVGFGMLVLAGGVVDREPVERVMATVVVPLAIDAEDKIRWIAGVCSGVSETQSQPRAATPRQDIPITEVTSWPGRGPAEAALAKAAAMDAAGSTTSPSIACGLTRSKGPQRRASGGGQRQ